MSITFATNCWEKDWKYLLLDGYLERMINNCDYPFDEKILCIGNVKDLEKVEKAAKKKIKEGVIDKYIIIENSSNEVLSFFDIDKDSFQGGYNYSLAPLTTIYACNTDLLLYFTGDVHIAENDYQWVKKASDLLLESDTYFVANPLWNNEYEQAANESIKETDSLFIGFGFSDQCFMVRTADLKKPIYNEKHPASDRYPKYAGESFEKRIDSYMQTNNLMRATYKDVFYIHENYKKRTLYRRLFSKRK